MVEYKRILFPTDFSGNARIAAPHVLELMQRFEAEVHVLHVLEIMLTPSDFAWTDLRTPEVEQRREEAAKEALTQLADELGLDAKRRHLAVAHGHPFAEIARYAEDNDIDLIVMATHGHSGLSHFLLGSTTERVVRKAPCPVLTVRRAKGRVPDEGS